MVRTKLVRYLAAVALATALFSIPLPAAADTEHRTPGAVALQEGFWARLLAWIPESPGALLDITARLLSSADIDPDGRPASASPGASSDYSADIDPDG